jgi:hypothetical protein
MNFEILMFGFIFIDLVLLGGNFLLGLDES